MAKSNKPMTLGDLGKKISNLQANNILYISLLIAVFFVGYLLARVQMQGQTTGSAIAQQDGGALPAEPAPGEERVDGVATGNLTMMGDENAPVTIIEFSDFECPFCEAFYSQTLSQIKSEYVDTGKAKLYYRHYPLAFHPAAVPAGLASECANEQGRFWEYHDMVFENQARISGGGDNANTALKEFAANLGLNANQFDSCFDSAKYQANVDQDLNDGTAAGVSGTPTVFVNGRRIVGAQPYATFKAIIDEELNQ